MSATSKIEVSTTGNHLYVNSKSLEIDETTPEYLYEILNLGRTAILNGIEDFYDEMNIRNPDAKVSKAPVRVVRLGTNSQRKSILTKEGRNNLTNIHKQPSEVSDKYKPLWHAINHSGFSTEVRSGWLGPNVGGIWLMLKDIDQDDSAKQYFAEAYPNFVACDVLPDIEEGIAPVRIRDRVGLPYDYIAPTASLRRLTPPRLQPELEGIFDQIVGLGLLGCRVIDDDITESLTLAEFPTIEGPKRLFLPYKSFAKVPGAQKGSFYRRAERR